MKKRLAEIALRRCEILKVIAAQRVEITEISTHFEKPMQVFDAGVNTVSFIRHHPKLIFGSVAAILTLWRHSFPGLSYIIPPVLQFTFNRMLSNSNSKDANLPDLDSMN